MNQQQRRLVDSLKEELRAAAERLGQQTSGPVSRQSDRALAARMAHEAGMGFYLDENFVVDPSGITIEWLINRVNEQTAERLDISVAQLEALSPDVLKAMILGDRIPTVNREHRFSDRGER